MNIVVAVILAVVAVGVVKGLMSGSDAQPNTASPEEIAKVTKRHTKLINEAKANIEGGNPDEAKIFLDLARTLGLKEPTAKAKEAEIEKEIAFAKRHTKLINEAKANIEGGDPDEAKIFLDLARTLDRKEPTAKAKEAEIEKEIAKFGNTQK